MKIAVTYENGEIFQHFGRTEAFKLYEIEDGKIVSSVVKSTDGQGHGALAGILFAEGVNVLICGGIGPGAVSAVSSAGIQVCAGVCGSADEAVNQFLAGKLDSSSASNCNHEGHEGHDENGGCGCHCS